MDILTSDNWPWRVGRIDLLPILHTSYECCIEVRRAIEILNPSAIGIEYPRTMQEPILAGIQRLPFISAVQFQQGAGRPAYVLIEPCEPLVEAARCGLERNISVSCIDRDTDHPPCDRRPWPDPYAIQLAGLNSFVESWLECVKDTDVSQGSVEYPEEHMRELTMAYHLQGLAESHERVLGVVGMAHLPALLQFLQEPQVEPLGRARRADACLVQVHPESVKEILGESPFMTEAYERWRSRQSGLELPRIADEEKTPQGWNSKGRMVAFPGADIPDQQSEDDSEQIDWDISHLPIDKFDRWELIGHLLQKARMRYYREDGERLSAHDLRNFLQYSRNQALIDSRLIPDVYQTILSARGIGGDDFAYRFWEAASDYPWQNLPGKLPTVRISFEDLGLSSRPIRFERRMERQQRIRKMLRPRPQEKFPGEWRQSMGNDFICSHSPEDIVIESYGHFLQKRGQAILSEEQTRVEPFVSSILDGVDVRETIRHWYEKKIYVRECLKVKGKVGSVIVIFDEDERKNPLQRSRYSWTMTWQGEHEQESDMALYATSPQEKVVGPGIGRCEYGGFLMSYPPGRMFYVWEDPTFDLARNKAERLLLAGLDYSEDRYIVYAAAQPPRSWFHSYANRLDRKIVYIPLGHLSPVTLKRLRTFHVLSGHHVRSYAKDYIW